MRIRFQWSLVFPCCEYRCQLPAEGLAGAMSGSACLSSALAGWSELRGAGVGWTGDAWKVVELFTFQLCLKLFWCFVWLTLMFSFCVTDSASLTLSLLHKPLSPPLPFCHGLRVSFLLVLGGLWKIYNRWAVFEGYVFSNYLFAEGFEWVATGPNVLPTQSCCLPVCYLLPMSQIEISKSVNETMHYEHG